MRVREQAEVQRVLEVRAGRARGAQPADDLLHALGVSAGRLRPAAQYAAHREAVREAAVAGRVDGRLGPAQRLGGLAAAGMQRRHLGARRGQAVRARGLLGQLDGAASALERLRGVPEEPQRERRPVMAGDRRVVAERRRERVVVTLRLVRRAAHAAVRVCERAREGALVEQRAGDELGALHALGGGAVTGADGRERRRRLAADLIEGGERQTQRGKGLAVGQVLRDRARALQVLQRSGRGPAFDGDVRLPEIREQLRLHPPSHVAVRQVACRLQRVLEVGDGLPVGAARHALARGKPQEPHRRRGLAAGDVVHGDRVRARRVRPERRVEALPSRRCISARRLGGIVSSSTSRNIVCLNAKS